MHAKRAFRDPLFSQCHFRHNFFAIGPNALQRFQLLSQNGDEVRVRSHPFTSRFHGSAVPLITRVFLYITAPFISSDGYYSHNSSESSLRRSMVCLLLLISLKY